jgi:ferredoxin
MDMHAKPQDQLIFHLTGRRPEGGPAASDGLRPIDGLDLRPALLAPYRDLNAMRHDYPVVLDQWRGGPEFVRSLSGLVDEVLKDLAPRGIEGERLRRHALQLEREIRQAVAEGATGTLAEQWDSAAARLGAREGETLEQVLRHAGGALPADGEVLGCTPEMPARLITQAWQAAQRAKARQFRLDLSRLVHKLSDILRAAYSHSQIGRQPQSLKAAVGAPHQDQFDFDALSRIVGKGAPRDELPAARHGRLVRTLGVLESQRFFAPHDGEVDEPGETFDFVFDNCAAAAAAYRQRLADLAELVRAISVAELEARGHYVEAEHDLFFAAFDESALTADDLARFPDYLVCIPPDRNDAAENAGLMEMLSSGLPVKVLVQTSDLLEDASIGTGRFAFGVRSARLATAAMGLGGMFVLQSASANLYALRGQIGRGMACRGPALFSVFARDKDPIGTLPPYLGAAAAMQSRAFPAFSYDAAAGANWATRFSLENNPQPDDDWSVETLDYADDALQRASERCAFSFADFVLCDPRHAAHFALVPRERWNTAMLPAADWLALDEREAAKRVPYLLAVDRDDALQRVIVDAKLMQATRRCLLLWHRLQEHGGVHDSHAERLLAREKAAWTAAAQPAPATTGAPAAATATADMPAAPGQAEAAAPAHSRDEAWIDTARCPSCNECQLINDRMFGYDERKQAFIKDLKAGTYRQLVEAAESCQVAIIHPGAPRDPNEPGLEELLARAEPFR